jgi:HSP20 family protein
MNDPFDMFRRRAPELSSRPSSAEWRPQVDVYETDDSVVVVMELAGVSPEDIDINVEGRRLFVKGARVPAPRARTKRIYHLEIPHGPFHVAVDLPVTVDSSGAEAVTRNGLLEIVLPLPRPFHPTVESGAGTPMGEKR